MAKHTSPLDLTSKQREALEGLLRASKTPQSLIPRIQIVMHSADGLSPPEVAKTLGVSRPTVYRWRARFQELGVDGLADAPRSGQPRKLTQGQIQAVLQATVERIPRESTHWSVRLMAEYADLTTWQVRQIWQAAGLKPHRLKTFKISNDPNFAEKVIDVVGLYMNPPHNALILSVDEKTQIQALDRTQPQLPMKPGQIERRTHDYKRNGTTNLYAAFNILTGEVMGRTTKRHRSKEFLDFLRQIDRSTPKELDLHLILDNSSTHKTQEVRQWLEARPRFKLHFTPTSASWLNAVESWFSSLERRAIHRGVFTSVEDLRREIHRIINEHNALSAKPFRWTQSAEVILEAVNRAKQL
ncbi:putative transposase [Magnetococcus marinus MC-1]|uniref:Putative transposase n=1 Tax=Magnetococcus marinus (strain ATCC BAA-1437 / JCM 17883 / MC-1) TaxID=156889 RepID=A0LAU3_MAGMM|nr:IS630 family transposase [Magnetococcus marinus]ABK45086.1 putative transposase [Magnetococcus marinus MC-1]